MKLGHGNKKSLLRFIKSGFCTALFLVNCFCVNAQPGCPAVDVLNNGTAVANKGTVQLPCGTSCTNLTAVPFEVGSTGTYEVSQIAYNPFSFTTGTAVLVHTDDLWSAVINLPFKFCFFDTVYTSLIIGSNGNISFNTANAGVYNPWPISNPIPSAADIGSEINNGVMGPWEDIDPTHKGNIYYQIIGAAPCRQFVVSWDQCGYYGDPNSVCRSCDTNKALYATSQIVLYETTNVIEIYIQQKQDLFKWNGGKAVEGIENNSATVAYTVPGRNATDWTANNDAWRFTPNGPSIVSVDWYKGATKISSDSAVQVCPTTSTTYVAQAVYIPCSGGVPVTVADTITVAPAGTLDAGLDSTPNVTCHGLNNGSAYAHVSGGNPPVTYGWSTGSNALSIHNLSPGTYWFSVTDATGCIRADTFTITQPNLIGISATVTNPACHGACNGMIATIDTGGTDGPYSYVWNTSPVQNTTTAINLCGGSYAVTVSDANSCSASAAFMLTDPPASSVNQVSLTNVTCIRGNNGSVVVSAGGGFNGTVTFRWSNGETGPQDTALTAGNYTVTATDSLGCSAMAVFMITQPATGITLQPPAITPVQCFGNGNGSIIANATGGVGNYTYNWNRLSTGTSLTGPVINNLSADTYMLTVTDANGCTDTASYVLNSPPLLSIDSIVNSAVLCAGANGQAQVYTSGGTGTYHYTWSTSVTDTTSLITGLAGGNYSVTVTDANGCTALGAFNITQATPVLITLVKQSNVLCYDTADGSDTISISGGTAPYQAIWSNGAQGLSISGLSAGTYTVSVTDTNNCSASANYVITQPNALQPGIPTVTNIGCSGGTTGAIAANPNGGTQPYAYAWVSQSNNQTYNTQAVNNLSAGTYNVTVTDANGCSASAYGAILAVPPLVYSYDSTNVTCFNGTNGSISVSVLSGNPPYQFEWDNTPGTDSVYSNLPAGLVDLLVHDGDNCWGHSIINITQPVAIAIHNQLLNNVSCNGGSNGSILVNASGGTPGYKFNWSNHLTGVYDTVLTAGSYTLTVTDTNACTVAQTFVITQPQTLVSAPVVNNALCFLSTDGSINANPAGGTAPYSYTWSNGSTTQLNSGLAAGTYTCTIQDVLGCTLTITDSVGQPSQIQIADSVTAVKCPGQHSGSAFVYPSGGNPPYNYNVTNDSSNFFFPGNGVINGLDTGLYVITAGDTTGCTVQAWIRIPPALPDSFSTQVDSTLCYGPDYPDGAVSVLALTLQNGPFTYLLDDFVPQDTGYFEKLSAGPHLIIATNANGCIDSIPFVVPQPLPIVIDITPDSITLPLGGSQSVLVTCQNAANPAYSWSPALGLSCVDCPNPVVSPYTAGNYTLVVSVQNGPATCYDTGYLYVFVGPHSRAYFPNAFSPNGDGNNDVFQIYGEDIKTISLKIFDRWGEKVYDTENAMAGWDGTYKGVIQNIGVYTYEAVVTFLDNSRQVKNGTVTLLR